MLFVTKNKILEMGWLFLNKKMSSPHTQWNAKFLIKN